MGPQDPEDQRGAAAAVEHGLSTSDFGPALGRFLGSSAGLSASVITKLIETWKAEQQAFAARDLSEVDYVYLWAGRATRRPVRQHRSLKILIHRY